LSFNKEVTKEEFYKYIGPLDVILDIVGDYPYTTIFKMRKTRKEMGRTIGSYDRDGEYQTNTKYLIS
jgi:hypothetical protein